MTHPYGQNIVACIWDFDKTLILETVSGILCIQNSRFMFIRDIISHELDIKNTSRKSPFFVRRKGLHAIKKLFSQFGYPNGFSLVWVLSCVFLTCMLLRSSCHTLCT